MLLNVFHLFHELTVEVVKKFQDNYDQLHRFVGLCICFILLRYTELYHTR